MQDNYQKELAFAISKVLKRLRKQTGKSLTLFCYEYSIPTSSLNDIETCKSQNPKIHTIYLVLKALGISGPKFFEMVEKELPQYFMEEND